VSLRILDDSGWQKAQSSASPIRVYGICSVRSFLPELLPDGIDAPG
jgi:hypothetical protein